MDRASDDHLRSLLAELVAEMEQKVPYAAAFVTRTHQLGVSSSSRDERVTETGPSAGAVLTVWNGRHFQERATGDLTPDGLRQAARELLDATQTAAPLPGQPGAEPGFADLLAGPPRHLDYRTPQAVDPGTVSLEEKLDLCRRGRDRAATLDPRIVEAECGYSEQRVESLFVNRRADLRQEVWRIYHTAGAVFTDNGVVRSDGAFGGGTGGFELAGIPDAEWEEFARRIPGLLQATPVEPGHYDVVVCPAAAGLIAHEVFGHGVETDMFLKGRARSREFVGRAVGSSLVDLYDDPTYPGGFGTSAFDDEGQPSSRTQVLEAGVFVQGLTDLNSAVRLGLPRTANGRRQGTNKVYPRMTNTYFGPGTDRLEDMIASIDKGVYLGMASSGMEDPKDWGVQCIISWGEVIENGRLTGRYHTNLGLTGYVPDLLGSVSMVGGDLKLIGGGCGKGYKEIVAVGMGGPHLRMKARLG